MTVAGPPIGRLSCNYSIHGEGKYVDLQFSLVEGGVVAPFGSGILSDSLADPRARYAKGVKHKKQVHYRTRYLAAGFKPINCSGNIGI
jgi:hypothetical protein